MDVSRETAAAVFGARLALAETYADLLATDGVTRGLIGPREVDRLWSRHLVNCGLLAEAVTDADDVLDVGSGAGLPGVPLALARPGVRVRLVEPLLRRATFLAEVVDRLDLADVTVVRARAEELHGTTSASIVTARAVAPLERLVPWCLPLVKPGGSLLAMKGERAAGELAEAEPVLRASEATTWSIEEYGAGVVDPPVRVVRVVAGDRPQTRGRRFRPATGSA